MKKLLFILLLFTGTYSFAQVKVNSEGDIIPTGIYPAVKSNNLKGTLHIFKSITDRNALPANFRDTGMLGYVIDSSKFYYLDNGLTNDHWKDLLTAHSALSNGLISTGPITLVDSTLTIEDTILYTINGTNYSQVTPSVFIINSADSGYYRKDLIYADSTGLHKLIGQQNTAFGVTPALPTGSIVVTTVDVYGEQIATPVPTIITPVPNLQQVTDQGNSTTNPIFINANSTQTPLRITSDFNRSNYLYFKNKSNGNWANTGFLFKNDVTDDAGNEWSGHWFRLMVGSTNSDMAKDASILMTNGTGGLKIVSDSGRITFNSGSPAYPYDTNSHVYKEMGAFETDGSFRLNNYKNNVSGDSVLSTDETGKIILKKVAVGDIDVIQNTVDSSSFGIKKLDGNVKHVVILADGLTGGSGSGTGIQSIQAGTNVTVDNTDPLNPIVSAAFNAYTKPQTDSIAALKANLSHTHPASDIVSGIMNTARLGTGTTNSSTVLFGDNVWRTYNGLIVDVPNVNTSTHVHSYYASVSQTTSFGFSNLQQLRIGGGNTSFGETGLYQLDSGNTNTSIGLASLPSLLDGSNNLGLGYWSYPNLKHGNYNIGIGTFNNDEGDTTLNNTLWISKNTNHMHYELDSASGTAPSIIGKDANGYWHVYQTPTGGGSYTLPTASSTILGGVKVGTGLAIDGSGVLSATGGGTYTASNGLTMVGSDVQLGGTLSNNTIINASGFQTIFTGTIDADQIPIVSINNSTTLGGVALKVNSSSNFQAAILASGNAYGISSSSPSTGIYTIGNIGIQTESVNGVALVADVAPSSTNSIATVVKLNRSTTGTAANGIGVSVDIYNNTTAALNLSNQIISKWTDATDATRTSEFLITGVDNATTKTLIRLKGNGKMILSQAPPQYTDNAAAVSGGEEVGTIYTTNGEDLKIVH